MMWLAWGQLSEAGIPMTQLALQRDVLQLGQSTPTIQLAQGREVG